MHAHPLVWCQQLDDRQRLPGQGILKPGQDVLLAHQLRIKHSSALGPGPEPRAAPTALRGKGPPGPGCRGARAGQGPHRPGPAPNWAPESGSSAAEGAPQPSRTREGVAGQALPTEALPSPRVSTAQARQSGGRSGSSQSGPWSPHSLASIGAAVRLRPAGDGGSAPGPPRHRLPSGGRGSPPASSLTARSGPQQRPPRGHGEWRRTLNSSSSSFSFFFSSSYSSFSSPYSSSFCPLPPAWGRRRPLSGCAAGSTWRPCGRGCGRWRGRRPGGLAVLGTAGNGGFSVPGVTPAPCWGPQRPRFCQRQSLTPLVTSLLFTPLPMLTFRSYLWFAEITLMSGLLVISSNFLLVP